ncbi:hypothetical protein [Rhizobium leguminosarum]|uniref:hypothetical protein n=1 Tax=Rhizobium leguminosarum TaxID=384 RepID=UPI0012F9BAF2|nr:hypothetical protein [Rhizobium leguminosarum]MVO95071.1 hypothetical protein [Rhizobium leguminosarum bv. phaseoli]
MASRNEPSLSEVILDELRLLKADIRIDIGAVRTDLGTINKKADDAHKRIDKYDNRIWGMSFVGGGVVAGLIMVLKVLFS